jgi:hypothetical protein
MLLNTLVPSTTKHKSAKKMSFLQPQTPQNGRKKRDFNDSPPIHHHRSTDVKYRMPKKSQSRGSLKRLFFISIRYFPKKNTLAFRFLF